MGLSTGNPPPLAIFLGTDIASRASLRRCSVASPRRSRNQPATSKVKRVVETAMAVLPHSLSRRHDSRRQITGVVQIRVTPKTRNSFTIRALSISGVTRKWHFLNHARFD